jgi:hypothetical protein
LELQNAENGLLSADLLQAIEIANHALIINTIGDYYAALSQDFRDAGEFTKPSEDISRLLKVFGDNLAV